MRPSLAPPTAKAVPWQLPLQFLPSAEPSSPAAAQVPSSSPATAAQPPAPLLMPARFEHPRASREIHFPDASVAYELKRSARRSLGFAVGADGLCVSAPRWTPQADIDQALRDKARWIVSKLGQARAHQQQMEAARMVWADGAELRFLGEPLRLQLDPRQSHGPAGCVLAEQAAEPASAGQATGRRLHVGLSAQASPAQLRDAVQAWLMRQARRTFTQRLDFFAPQLGVRWHKLSLSSANTRWGSASADGSIRLNWRLIHFRLPVIDYVVVHELAHLREMNHSPRFWQQVQTVLPDYAQRRGELQQQHLPPW